MKRCAVGKYGDQNPVSNEFRGDDGFAEKSPLTLSPRAEGIISRLPVSRELLPSVLLRARLKRLNEEQGNVVSRLV